MSPAAGEWSAAWAKLELSPHPSGSQAPGPEPSSPSLGVLPQGSERAGQRPAPLCLPASQDSAPQDDPVCPQATEVCSNNVLELEETQKRTSDSLGEKQAQLTAMQAQTEELEADLERLTTLKRQVGRPRAPQGHASIGCRVSPPSSGPWAAGPASC